MATWEIEVGGLASVTYAIPVNTLGRGYPRLAVVCGVHGDEPAALCIVSRFRQCIESMDLAGRIDLVVSANPLAQTLGTRVAPVDHRDLNRVAAGSSSGSITERTAAKLFELLRRSDLVITLHEFEMNGPTMAAFMNAGTLAVRRKTLAAIDAFSPRLIWVVDAHAQQVPRDRQYDVTLDSALASLGVVEFPVETTQLSLLTEEAVDETVDGLLRVAKHLNMIRGTSAKPIESPRTTRSLSAYLRKEVTADLPGLWQPEPYVELMQPIEEGQVVGSITRVRDLQDIQVAARSSGVLIQLRERAMVGTGTSLFSLGQRTDLKGLRRSHRAMRSA